MRRYYMSMLLAVFLGGLLASQAMGQGMRLSPEERTKALKDSLSLNAVQADSVLKIYKETDKQRQELFSSGQGDRQARMDAMRSLGEKTDAKIEAILTAAQKEKYEVMKKQRQARMQQFRRRSQ